MNIAIIGAMEEEINFFLANIDSLTSSKEGHLTLNQGKIKGIPVAIINSGIGKVNASMNTYALINAIQPDLVINVGSAGGLHNSLKIEDVIVATELSYHDVDVQGFGYKFGQVPKMPERYHPSELALKKLKQFEHKTIALKFGLMTSSDSFIDDLSKSDAIKKYFPDVMAVDMESTAIAQTCHNLNVPFCVIRSISDHASQKAPKDFKQFLEQASKNSFLVTNFLIESISSHKQP